MTAWRVIRVTLGVILAVLGTVAIIASLVAASTAVGVVSVVGRTGVLTAPLGALASAPSDVAVVVDGVSARLEPADIPPELADALAQGGLSPAEAFDLVGDLVLIATPPADRELFLGTAPVESVDEYLFGYPYSVAERQGQTWTSVSVPGEGQPAPPTGQTWWEATATGSPAVLPATGLRGSTFAVMNADGSPGVEAVLRLEYRAPRVESVLQGAAITAAATGLGGLLLVLGSAALIVGRRRTGRHA